MNVRAAGVAVMAALLLSSSLAGAMAAGGVAWDSDPAPEPVIPHETTKAVHDMDWGTSADAARKYESDSGDIVKMKAEVNTSYDNPYKFRVTDINATDYGSFPHSKDEVSALDAGEWSTATSDSTNVSPTATNVETAPGVDAVELSTSGMGSGDTATFTFSNFSVTSDESKRFVQAAVDVNSLASGAKVEVQIVDDDGDMKVAEINQSRSSGEDLVANSSGEGYLYQRQLGKMDTVANGDGSFGDIQSVEVVVYDADATLSVAGLNVEKLSTWDLGSKMADTDGDDELETVDHTEVKSPGDIAVHSLDTLGSTFENARVHDLWMAMNTLPELAGSEDIKIETTRTEDKYPGYHGTATIHVRMGLADAYDLDHSGPTFGDTQAVTSDRIIAVEYAEGVSSDTEFSDIEDSSYTDKTSLYTGEGTNVTVDDTVQSGSYGVVKYELKLTKNQFNAIQASGGGGGAGAIGGGVGNIPIIGGIVVGLLGLARRFGGS